jgi:hypothetical protein
MKHMNPSVDISKRNKKSVRATRRARSRRSPKAQHQARRSQPKNTSAFEDGAQQEERQGNKKSPFVQRPRGQPQSVKERNSYPTSQHSYITIINPNTLRAQWPRGRTSWWGSSRARQRESQWGQLRPGPRRGAPAVQSKRIGDDNHAADTAVFAVQSAIIADALT